MSVAQTSAEAYHSLSPAHYLQPKQQQIMALFGPETLLSRQQISERARMAINGVCGRVDSLVAAGLLEEHGDRIDPHTHKRQKLLRLKRAD
jgi:DNA-binding MarR family transcriptional regulator